MRNWYARRSRGWNCDVAGSIALLLGNGGAVTRTTAYRGLAIMSLHADALRHKSGSSANKAQAVSLSDMLEDFCRLVNAAL